MGEGAGNQHPPLYMVKLVCTQVLTQIATNKVFIYSACCVIYGRSVVFKGMTVTRLCERHVVLLPRRA
jgi:hypothetical protein